jgi:hypothetical protein
MKSMLLAYLKVHSTILLPMDSILPIRSLELICHSLVKLYIALFLFIFNTGQLSYLWLALICLEAHKIVSSTVPKAIHFSLNHTVPNC